MSTPLPPDDAQRELEQRALRNVRSLVDKMEGMDQVDHARQKRTLVALIVGTAVVVGLLVGALVYVSHRQAGTKGGVVIDTAKPPAGAPAAPKK